MKFVTTRISYNMNHTISYILYNIKSHVYVYKILEREKKRKEKEKSVD